MKCPIKLPLCFKKAIQTQKLIPFTSKYYINLMTFQYINVQAKNDNIKNCIFQLFGREF